MRRAAQRALPRSSTGELDRAASGGAAQPTAAPAAAVNPATTQKVAATLRLDWVPGPHHIGPLLALKKGYYAQEGLDLSIQPGKGSGVTVQSVGAGQDMFGFADAGIMAVAASKGAPLIMIANTTPLGPSGIISLGTKITDPKQLEGKTIGAAAGDASFAAFPAVAKKNNLSESSYKVVTIEAASKAEEGNRRINISLTLKQGFLAIKCENTYADPIATGENGAILSGKASPKNHGYGITQMRHIAEKYGGMLDISWDQGVFTLQTALNLK